MRETRDGRDLRILGVDPGTLATGWGVVVATGRAVSYVAHGVIRTRPKEPLWVRLKTIHDQLATVIEEHTPDVLSLERVFVSKNVQSALKLGHTRGAIMVAGMERGLEFSEYTASQVKSTVAGSGRATKGQMQEMVRVVLGLSQVAAEDASDALAAAICHAHVGAFQRALAGAR